MDMIAAVFSVLIYFKLCEILDYLKGEDNDE